MRTLIIVICLFCCLATSAQVDFVTPYKECRITGSTTIYDYKHKKWLFSDKADAKAESLPASTFKIINLLIALQTGVIKDEYEIVKWTGIPDTSRYGYRPDIYHDMTVKEAFEVSAGWVFIELAKKVGKTRYKQYLSLCNYGNLDLSEKGTDFWNFGAMGISPVNQIGLLIKVYEGNLPFSARNISILKRVMITEHGSDYTIRSKTGWTRVAGNGQFSLDAAATDIGWWVGYVTRRDNVYFFATRLTKPHGDTNAGFGQCRKDVTKNILKQLRAID